MAQLGIAPHFLSEFVKLERSVQAGVQETFLKFAHATHAGVHLEKIVNVRDPRLRSIRIGQFWRGIVLAPDSGDSYTLLKVLPHDAAYDWAQRRRASVNQANGAIELRDVVGIEEQRPQLAEQAESSPARLFAHVNDADLRRLGIDDDILPLARTLTAVDQLDALRGMVPEPQHDALMGLAAGMTPEAVWNEIAASIPPAEGYDPEDVTAAVERPTSRVVLVSGPEELMEVFSRPFAMWRIYLHPAQHRVAYGSYGGPARVTGGPGTGKTVTALHRARHLATSGEGPVLLTTFTTTLAQSLDDNLRMLVEDEDLRGRIEVRNVDQLANRIVTARYGWLSLLTSTEEQAWWLRLILEHQLDVTEAFLAQEWRHVVLAQDITTLEGYLAAARRGRGRPLGQSQRERIWPALTAFTRELRDLGRWTHETVCVEAAQVLAETEPRPYRHVVVDEAQDLSPWQWRMLRAAASPGRDDMFLAGDTNQRIYDNRVSLRRMGIEVGGRSERLTINYRTTAEILGWSMGLLRGESVDDMDGGLETLAGCRSDVHGRRPILSGVATKAAELDQLVATVRDWLDDGVEPGQVGIAARSRTLVDNVVARLTSASLPAVSLAGRAAEEGEIAVATMHRMKGLEFRCVAVVGVGRHQVPAKRAVTPAEEDKVTHDLDIQRERCLLFVACTRARERLAVSWYGTPSALLPR